MSRKKRKNVYSGIGGQAVLEGVMMRNSEKWAVAVRTADKQITVKTGIYKGVIPFKSVGKIPILRGVCSFIDSLYLGMKTLMFSADLFAEESEKELEERELAQAIDRFIRTLSEEEEFAFIARYYFLATEREIAEKRGYTRSKVSMMLKRSRDRLKKHLLQEGLCEIQNV